MACTNPDCIACGATSRRLYTFPVLIERPPDAGEARALLIWTGVELETAAPYIRIDLDFRQWSALAEIADEPANDSPFLAHTMSMLLQRYGNVPVTRALMRESKRAK